MSTITLTMPEEMKVKLEQDSQLKGYSSVSDYVQDVIRAFLEFEPDAEYGDYLARPAVQAKLESLLMEGWNSPIVAVDDTFWEQRRKEFRAKHPNVDFDAQ